MINIFLSCSSKDHDYIKTVIDNLTELPDKYSLIYFMQPYNVDTSMELILHRLNEADLFIVFVSNNSLESAFVQEEIREAVRLSKLGVIKGFCSIIIEPEIQVAQDYRIPEYILSSRMFYTHSPYLAIEQIKDFIFSFKGD